MEIRSLLTLPLSGALLISCLHVLAEEGWVLAWLLSIITIITIIIIIIIIVIIIM